MTTMATPTVTNDDNKTAMKTTTTTTTTVKTKPAIMKNDISQEIPIFLRKTWHMINTSDDEICGWSEDGETFLVKEPKKFENEIIPQFFKHNKFSSFVRQLNFYSFRKLKTNDCIRIDHELDKATANHWRFYHPNFQRGRLDLLALIKRNSSTPRGTATGTNVSATTSTSNHTNAAIFPNETPSSAAVAAIGDVAMTEQKDTNSVELKSEVTTLKERIDVMNKNIDLLTTMVNNVTLSQKQGDGNNYSEPDDVVLNGNNKRSKITPDEMISSTFSVDNPPELPMPASITSNSDIDSFGSSNFIKKDTSLSSELSDEGFVDSLFTAFKGNEGDEEDDSIGDLMPLSDDVTRINNNRPWLTSTSISSSRAMNNSTNDQQQRLNNRPRKELMNRLSDALSLLPRDIQELIVDRLIQSITSPKEIQSSLNVATALAGATAATSPQTSLSVSMVPQSPTHSNFVDDSQSMMTDDEGSTTAASCSHTASSVSAAEDVNLPSLAAAALAALLSQYGKEQQPQCRSATQHHVDKSSKVLSIPVHA